MLKLTSVLEVLAKHITEHLNAFALLLEPEEGNCGGNTIEYKRSLKSTRAIFQSFCLEGDLDVGTNAFLAGYFHFSAHAWRLDDAVDNCKT
jgi:hypothetical protein